MFRDISTDAKIYMPEDFNTKNDVFNFMRSFFLNYKRSPEDRVFLCSGECKDTEDTASICSHQQDTWVRFTEIISYTEFERAVDLDLIGLGSCPDKHHQEELYITSSLEKRKLMFKKKYLEVVMENRTLRPKEYDIYIKLIKDVNARLVYTN